MPAVTAPAHKKGDVFVDYEEKVFEDVKGATGGEGARHLPHRRLRGLDRPRQPSAGPRAFCARDSRPRSFSTARASRSGLQRGFPKIGDEAFPGHQNFNNQITKFIGEGGKVYACRFALQALYGHGEPSLIEGIRPINPLDVLDLVLLHRRDNAFILDTWTL